MSVPLSSLGALCVLVVQFSDENENRKIDIGFLGPKEPYGFSNNVFGTFGPPPFEQAKFSLAAPELRITIETR